MSLVLIAAGVPDATITESTGQCNRSVRQLRKDVSTGNTKNLFVVNGGGRKSKLADIGQEVIDEIAAGNYYSRQQFVDMIEEKFGIKTSRSAVDRLLKKTASNA
jgi:transposase